MATLIKPDGSRQEIPVPTLEEAQALIGGYVERVAPRQSPDIIFLCDEDGLHKRLPPNPEGQKLYGTSSPIVGPIIVISKKEKGWRKWL